MKLKGVNRARTAGEGKNQLTAVQGGNTMNAVMPQGALQRLNEGVLENIDDVSMGESYVSLVQGSYLFKDTNQMEKEIVVQIVRGRRIYQKFDEEQNRYVESDVKLDNDYKFKINLWFVLADDAADPEDEAQLYKITLPTASAMVFIGYAEKLAKAGYAVNQVRTKMFTTPQQNKNKQHYFRAGFEAFDLESGEPLNITHS
jgi:hypothetical protein